MTTLQRHPAGRRHQVTQLVSLLMALMIACKLLIVYNTLEDIYAIVFTSFSLRLVNVVHLRDLIDSTALSFLTFFSIIIITVTFEAL